MTQRTGMTASPLHNLEFDDRRSYLAIRATTDVVITIVNGGVDGEPFTVPGGENWTPYPVPTNPIKLTGTGILIRG